MAARIAADPVGRSARYLRQIRLAAAHAICGKSGRRIAITERHAAALTVARYGWGSVAVAALTPELSQT